MTVSLPRLFRIPLAAGCAVAAVACSYPGGLSTALADLGDFSANSRQLSAETDRDLALGDRRDRITARIAAKELVVIELVDARVTLTEAADQFLALNAGDADATDSLRARYDGSTDLERMARHVIDYVHAHKPKPASVIPRLESQFRARFGHPR